MASYTLGAYILDLHAGELRRGADKLSLPPKVFELLVYLVKNHGRLVGHNELLDALWPDTHVTAASLTRAVANLRRALRDEAHDPQYVETVPRRGYRLVASVREVDTDQPERAPFCLIHKGRPHVLYIGENILGRSDESVVPIHSPIVSRQHARLTVTHAGATLEDLGSKNGTYVRGQRVAGTAALHDRDEIRVGPIKLFFLEWPLDAPTASAEGSASGFHP
jgi:DNA-binding winged helix-turn-helix (wHTH) protein